MKRKAASGMMLMLLLISMMHFAASNSVARAISFKSDLLSYGIFGETEDWWRMFRHDPNHIGYSTSVVHEYIESLWNYTTDGGVRCSPAVVYDKVFVGSEDGYVYALNATAHELIKKSRDNIGEVVSSPAVVDGRVFVGSINGSVYALDETTLEVIWNFPTNDTVISSPAVADGKVFVGSLDHHVYALNATTDKQTERKIWSNTTYGSLHSSPAVSGDAVYVGSDSGYVFKFNVTNGHEIWRFLTADLVRSSPAVVDGKVFVGVNDGRVYALNATTGKYLWHFETGGAVVSSPAVAYGVVFVGSNDTRVYALNATDGRQIWTFATGGAVVSSPAVAFDKVFVGSDDKRIYGLNVTDPNGDGIISPEEVIWSFPTGGLVESSPAIAEGKVFVGSLDKNVYAFAANRPPQAFFDFYPVSPIVAQMVTFNASASNDTDGNITSYTWNFRDSTLPVTENDSITTHTYNVAGTYNVTLTLMDDYKPVGTNATWRIITVLEAWPMFRHDPTHAGYSTSPSPVLNTTLWNQTIGPVSYSSPAVFNDVIFIGSTNGTLYALNAMDGNVTWSRSLGDSIHSSPAVVDNMVFIASENGTISAWDIDGNFLWTNHTQGKIFSSPMVSGNRVFISCEDSFVYAFDKMNGNFLWLSPSLGGAVDSSPAVASGRVFVGSWNGTVYAINEANGTVIKSYVIGAQIRIVSSPTVAYGKVFIGAGNGSLYALNMDCEFQWQKPTGGAVDSSPAVAYNKVFVGSSDGKVYALDVTNGTELWSRTIGPVGWSSPAVSEGKVFIGTTDGKICALCEENGENGDIVWTYQTDGPVDSSPAILNDTLYVGSKDGNIYAFRSQVHDIAVTEVTPSSTRVSQGEIININVTIRNEGTFNETNINVTAYYYNNTFTGTICNITILSLARGTKITQPIPWDTTNVTPGTYNISVNATPVLNETETLDNNKTDGLVEILPKGIRYINVTNVTPLKTVVGETKNLNVSVTVKNQGDYQETFNITTYANTTEIQTRTVTLEKGNSTTITFTWNTSGFAKGNYNISAKAWPVPGEIERHSSYLVFVGLVGDVNADGIVDIEDIYSIALAYGSVRVGMEYWHTPPCGICPHSPNLDINCDGIIDIEDIYTTALQYGETDP